MFVNGEAPLIHNAKAKELLALLVDRRGAYVSQGDIISCLWEDESVNKVTLARVRKIVMILRNTLKEYHLEDLIESKKGHAAFEYDKSAVRSLQLSVQKTRICTSFQRGVHGQL